MVTPVLDNVPPEFGSKVKVLKDPAAGVVAPIVVLSMVPSESAILLIEIEPVPLACNSMSSLLVDKVISLSVKFKLLSICKFEILTLPVPPGSRRILALEADPIMLSLKVKLSIATVPVAVVLI